MRVRVTFGRRLAAYLIDRACAGLLAASFAGCCLVPLANLEAGTAAFDAAVERAAVAAVGIWGLVHMAYFSLFTGFSGQTPGKLLLGLAVVAPDGGPPGLARALLREVAGRILASLPLGLGYFWALGGGAGWHDMLAKTHVVSVEGKA